MGGVEMNEAELVYPVPTSELSDRDPEQETSVSSVVSSSLCI